MFTHRSARLVPLRVAADYLSLSIGTLRSLITSGKLMAIRSGPRSKILVDIHELESFVERNLQAPDARQEEVK